MGPLTGRRIAIVEDDALLMLFLRDALELAGGEIIHAANDLPSAMAIAALNGVDVAVVDVNLRGEEAFPAAAEFMRNGVPVVFTSGSEANCVPLEMRPARFVRKPYTSKDLVSAVDGAAPRIRPVA